VRSAGAGPAVRSAGAGPAGEQPAPEARALARSLPPAPGGTTVPPGGIAPGEEVELEGGSPLALAGEARTWVEAQRHPVGVRVRLGTASRGMLRVRHRSGGLETEGPKPQELPLDHPLLNRLRPAGLEPVLLVRVQKGLVAGHFAIRDSKRLYDGEALHRPLERASALLGWVGLDGLQLPIAENALVGRQLKVTSTKVRFGVSRFLRAEGSFGIDGQVVTFAAQAQGSVPGLADITVPISLGPDGSLTGSVTVAVTLRNFSGQLTAAFGHGLLDVHGTADYRTERMSGSVTVVATDVASAKALTDSQLPAEVLGAGKALIDPTPADGAAQDGVAAAAPADGAAANGTAAGAGPRPGKRVVVGWGTLQVRLADWLGGEALVVMEPGGDVTVVGKITPKMDRPLVEQQPEKTLHLLSLKPRASYGIPVVGNVYVEASIDLEAFARFGPVTLDRMELGGTWSTNPEKLKSLMLTGTLNASAAAGLRLTAEGKAGIEILDHDIAIGVGLKAIAGIKGYVVATPRIGFREVTDPLAGKRGEFFIGGHLEMAAQPFLGLEGYFFIELDSPWWSLAPDKRWPWPIGSLEYAVPGQFGIGADVEHVLGSDKVPEITFGQVTFDADKFLTDMVDEKVPDKVARDDRKAGSWQEAPQPPDTLKTADAAGAGKSTSPAPSAAAGTGRAAPRRTPTGAPLDGARKPAVADAKTRGPAKDGGKALTPELQKRWQAALADLREVTTQARTNPLDEQEMGEVLAHLRTQHRFSELSAQRAHDQWLIHAAMNPKSDIRAAAEPKDGRAEHEEAPSPTVWEATVHALPGSEAEAVLRGDAVARAAGVPADIYQGGRVLVAADFPELDPRKVKAPRQGSKTLPVDRPRAGVSSSKSQELGWRADLYLIVKKGWLVGEPRVNQRQTTPGGGKAAPFRRPDLSLEVTTRFGRRMVHIEYDRSPATRSMDHARRILATDPTAIVILKIEDFDDVGSMSREEKQALRDSLGPGLRETLNKLFAEDE
jgi:hypothetical protein